MVVKTTPDFIDFLNQAVGREFQVAVSTQEMKMLATSVKGLIGGVKA